MTAGHFALQEQRQAKWLLLPSLTDCEKDFIPATLFASLDNCHKIWVASFQKYLHIIFTSLLHHPILSLGQHSPTRCAPAVLGCSAHQSQLTRQVAEVLQQSVKRYLEGTALASRSHNSILERPHPLDRKRRDGNIPSLFIFQQKA